MSHAKPVRLHSLDALRGVAALVVVFHHVCQSLPDLESNALLHRLFPGGGAVLVFFVLSGLVLALTFVDRDAERYLPFAVKRIFRIWPAFAAAILASALLYLVIGWHDVPGASGTFLVTWSEPLTATSLFEHLFMTGTNGNLDAPIWSLAHEMRISLLFPVLVFLILADWRLAIVASALLTLSAGALQGGGAMSDSLLATLRFVLLFVVGAVMALKLRDVRHRLEALPARSRSLLWCVSLVGVCLSPDYSDPVISFSYTVRLFAHGAAAACLVMLCATGNRSKLWLSTPIPRYLGRISYSLYLTHVVVLTTVVQAFGGFAPMLVLIALGVVLAIAVADLSERFIERPTTAFGRKLAKMLEQRHALPAI